LRALIAYVLPFSFMPLNIGPIALYFLWRLRHNTVDLLGFIRPNRDLSKGVRRETGKE
jgi:hypothetical protein